MLNAKTNLLPLVSVVPFDLQEFSSDFYHQTNSTSTISPNLSDLDVIYPYTSEEIPALAEISVSGPKTTQTPPILPQKNETVSVAVGQIGNALGNAGGTILGNLLNNVVQGLGNGVQESAGQAGATIVNSTLKEWFKKNWYYVTGGVLIFFAGIWYFVKRGKKSATKKTWK
jgi:hypothetical protein